MRIFVTGGTGFIGSHVVQELVRRGHKVTVLARNPEKVPGLMNQPKIEILKGTLYDKEVIAAGLTGKDACIHIALGWGDTALEMLEADTKPSIYIFETAIAKGIKNLIYTSSTAAIGELRDIMGGSTSARPTDYYGATKAATEAYLLALGQACNIRCNIIRPGYTFGNPAVIGGSMESDQRFYDIVRRAKNNEPIPLIQNDGTQFIDARDLARLYADMVESDLNREIFMGLGAEFVTWEEVAEMAVEYTGSKSRIQMEDRGWARGGFLFDVTPMEQVFGLKFHSKAQLKEHVAYIADNVV